jgi:hypothetical protein
LEDHAVGLEFIVVYTKPFKFETAVAVYCPAGMTSPYVLVGRHAVKILESEERCAFVVFDDAETL